MTSIPIGRPGTGGGGGSGFKNAEHNGHAVGFVNNEERRDVHTAQFGTAELVAFSEYVVCVTCGFKVWHDHMTFGKAMAPAILASDEPLVLGVIGKGDAQAGKNAAWLLFDASDEERASAQAWFDAHSVRMPGSGRIVIEEPETPQETESF